jgi:hypothetical protein
MARRPPADRQHGFLVRPGIFARPPTRVKLYLAKTCHNSVGIRNQQTDVAADLPVTLILVFLAYFDATCKKKLHCRYPAT